MASRRLSSLLIHYPIYSLQATESLLMCLPPNSVPHFEKLLFSVVMSILLYLYRQPKSKNENNKSDFVFSLLRWHSKNDRSFFLTSLISCFLRFLLGSEEDSSGKFLETANLSCHQIWRKTCLLLRQSGYYLPLPVASLKNILTLQPSPQCPHGGSSCLVYTLKVCNSDRRIEQDEFLCFFLLVCSTVHVLLSHKVSWLISVSILKSSKRKKFKI